MAALESKAVFRARGLVLGLDDAVLVAMANLGWHTVGSYAFACSYVPGQGDDSLFKTDVLLPVLGSLNHPMASVLRRFYFECYTMAASEMRSRLERTSNDPPRTMPQPEREQRFQKISRSIPGLQCTGVHEPAHAITDKMTQMLEQNQLRYISWTECPTRHDELMAVKTDRFWRPDSAGNMKEVVVAPSVNTDTSTDLRLMQALIRRGLAFDMSHLMKFETHELLRHLLMGELAREPPSHEYAWVTMAQLDRADREIFKQLAESCRGGLSPDSAGHRPLDIHMQKCLDSTAVRVMLMHLPATHGVNKRVLAIQGGGNVGETTLSARAKKKAKKAAAKVAVVPTAVAQGKSAGKGGAKGVGKSRSSTDGFVPMPVALRGMHPRTAAGENICFAFNLTGGCAAGGACPKGKHVCCKCLAAGHAAAACTVP